jgi:hypothetical protein
MYPGNKGMQKADILYELAQAARGGCIVEVGSSTGFGTIALALGTRDGKDLPVYAVDDFTDRRGWHNEPYTPENLTIWTRCIDQAGLTDRVTLVRMTAEDAVYDWTEDVALLFWDPGVKIETVRDDCLDWADWITFGGVLALNDTLKGELGTDAVVAELVDLGIFELEAVRYGIRVLRRI